MPQSAHTLFSIRPGTDFTLANLPYGVFSTEALSHHVGIAIGEFILDLTAAEQLGMLADAVPASGKPVFSTGRLNDFMAMGPEVWAAVRELVQKGLADVDAFMAGNEARLVVPQSEARMHLPVEIGDYTDFYSSEYHATNVGAMFRPDNPLLPNWKHMPIAYHGRSSSIVVSGMEVRRPQGQTKAPDAEAPSFGPTRQMDYELETAFIVGVPNGMGHPVPIGEAERHIFGMVLFNDWSARDIQSWEYQPLGPFLAKNFCSVMSPWVVPMAALEPFRVESPKQDPAVLPYLQGPAYGHFDINLEVCIRPGQGEETRIGLTNHKHLYWSQAQQLAHHTVSGCNLRAGDVCASGTISGPTPDSLGCLLETTKRGKNPVKLADGTERGFLLDGDEVILRGFAGEGENRVGFGECRSKVLAAGQ